MINKKAGFTLLEILVVIIIVGVLASVAMPTLFRNVKRSQATEALNTLGLIKRGIEACMMQFGGNVVLCAPNTPDTFDRIGMADPSNSAGNAGSHFNYTITCGGAGPAWNCSLTATDVDDAANTVTLNYTNGGVTRVGAGAFLGIQ